MNSNSLLIENAAIKNRILEIFKENDIEDIKESDFDKGLNDIGFNSINFIKNIVAIECEYDIEFEDDKLILGVYESLEDFIVYTINKIKEMNV